MINDGVMKKIITPWNGFIWCLLWFLFLVADVAVSWDIERQLPINAQNYTAASTGASFYNINISYSFTSAIPRGQTFLFEVLIPPGTTKSAISAQSNSWQCAPHPVTGSPDPLRCPIMDGFDHYPGELCTPNSSAQCGVSTQDLHSVTARLSDILYPTESTSPKVVTEPRYVYFVLYQQPLATNSFFFGSNLGITISISDIDLYTQWRNARPWAGGPLGNTIDGIGETPETAFTLNITPTSTGLVTSSPAGIQCGGTATNCSANYLDNTQVTLIATANPNFVFSGWSNDCIGSNNVISVTMNTNKTCHATFEQKPENLPEPEIELFDGDIHLSDDFPEPIQFNPTEIDKPVTKVFTIQNTGTGVLNLTDITLPSGFSLVGNLPSLIQPNGSIQIIVQLDAASEGIYSGNLSIINNDSDENPFDLAIEGSVVFVDKVDLNEGNWVFGHPDTSIFSDKVKIKVTANRENADRIFEPLTRDDELKISTGRSVDINATITPDSNHSIIYVVIVAGWDSQEQLQWDNALLAFDWYQKTPSLNMLDQTGWVEWGPDSRLASPSSIIPYATYLGGKAEYPINVFTGQLIPPQVEGFGQARRVHFFIGYGIFVPPTNPNDPQEGKIAYIMSQPITFQLPVSLTPESLEINTNIPKVIIPQVGSEGRINSCQVSDNEIANVNFDQDSFACVVTGLKAGSTILTVTRIEPSSISVTTINVIE